MLTVSSFCVTKRASRDTGSHNSVMASLTTSIKNSLRKTPFRKLVMRYRHRGLTNRDVFLASYPRSGNTWLKSLLSSVLFGEAMQNFSDTEDPVIPIVGFHHGVDPILPDEARLIKTHEAFQPEYDRALVIVRDPRDVVLSEYRLQLRFRQFFGSFDEFVAHFVTDSSNGPPNWGFHTESWLNAPLSEESQLLLHFEKLKADTPRELRRVLEFLAIATDDESIEAAISQNTVDHMARRHASYDSGLKNGTKADIPAVNKGKAGGWRESLTGDQVRRIEAAFGQTMARLGYERSLS